MTRKDYVQFAKMLKDAREKIPNNLGFDHSMGINTAYDHIENELVAIFQEDNERFSSMRFRETCK